jgi:AcrR family transcriptional regulator
MEASTSFVPAPAAGRPGYPPGATIAERKRAVTRAALADAALSLALERGLEHVTVPDIAAAAGVSPRTFNNYFASKEEAVTAPAFDRMARILAVLGQRPAAEPAWEAVTAAILAQFPATGGADPQSVSHAGLVRNSPALWGEQLKVHAAIERLLAAAVAERLGAADGELRPRLIAAAAIGAARAAFGHWLDAGGRTPLRRVLAQALAETGAGVAAAGRGAGQ